MSGALVSCLLNTSCPHAIRWAVWSFIIEAFKSVLRAWSGTHVLHEDRKRANPFVTDSNSFSSVNIKPVRLWIGAALNHVGPDYIFRLCAHSSGSSRMMSAGIASSCLAPGQINSPGEHLFSADTLTPPPHTGMTTVWSAIYNRQLAKYFSVQISQSSHTDPPVGLVDPEKDVRQLAQGVQLVGSDPSRTRHYSRYV